VAVFPQIQGAHTQAETLDQYLRMYIINNKIHFCELPDEKHLHISFLNLCAEITQTFFNVPSIS
jgi:hypothetical protein